MEIALTPMEFARRARRLYADREAVVDGDLRVKHMDGLRVVDASVMPDLVSGNINACVVMIAEKASDAIRGVSHSAQTL